ncbi:MAG: Prenyltransferase/squalene oxidase [Thermodesulfobacterium sp. 37_54]|jgi:hypothetical protein|uniref:Prenyltransferase alpha-alpha toroid domain-containing protein n=2 Tax=Thermodesulfobacterium commune TaxID=1741 RepID=A0A075WZ01_9BACT|nr:prenyltransferase/squalene oxidase repeat-containing protein [Thermodesulfobacterium commune]KUJ98345.1 MAG: Prenyltransferase/squalene oxidase [Thermodesulfobacterium sp. 37_54]MDK2860925.1 hypothetical protein [Thermodesulfobacterium sp.]AIH03897.1 hypothetical protein HL41_03365 [Thermodesulfobacterium commune DSM 2178]KUK19936.1 MAG: Prenyltransferase/squalene oxidase [Thermodesulfobacterium commune]KUK37696.1 MAG: Prenyltransferase/squalene oxidase [Thermodesulfobacterium commune]
MKISLKENIWKQVYQFVKMRKRENGGFGATPYLPPTIEDTYYALEILKALEKFDPSINSKLLIDQRLKLWSRKNVVNIIKYAIHSYKMIYYLIKIIQNLQDDKSLYFLKNRCKELFCSFSQKNHELEKVFYILKSLRSLDLEEIELNFNLTWGLENIKEAYQLVWLWKNYQVDRSFPIQEVLKWLKEDFNPDGGYGFYPGTTSYLENTFYALKIYSLLEIKPENLNQTKEFIISCYVGKGGFARKPGATAFLESTYYAVKSFEVLLSIG